MWLELELEPDGQQIRVSGRGSRGERPPPRVLAIAPSSGDHALAVLREALDPSIEAGEVEWLDPIAGGAISARVLYDPLRRGKSPHRERA